MSWTPETIQQLRDLWAEGYPTAEIGRRLGVSKNAVIGRAHRLKLPPRPSPIYRKASADKPDLPYWTDERDALLRKYAGKPWDWVAAQIRQLPGRPVTLRQCRHHAAEINALPAPSSSEPARKPRPFSVKTEPARKPRPFSVKPKPAPVPVVPKPEPEVRGKPGVWLPPIGRTMQQIEAIAVQMGFAFGSVHDLPALNKRRVEAGYAPLAVNCQKKDDAGPMPGRLTRGMAA